MITLLFYIYLLGVIVTSLAFLYFYFEEWVGIISLENVIDFVAFAICSWCSILWLTLALVGKKYGNIIIYKRKKK